MIKYRIVKFFTERDIMKLLKALLLFCLIFACASGALCEGTVDEALTVEQELELYKGNRDIIYLFLTEELKLNHAAACGVIANIHVESRFNPEALGDFGTSYGICQWHNKRYTRLIEWSEENGYDYTELSTQLWFMKYELENKYAFVYERLKNTSDTPRGAYSVGNYWCIYYEKPKNKYVNGEARGELARMRYYNLLPEEE